jgi:glutamate racemase
MDSLILGCTHYPFLSDLISDVMGPSVELINAAGETAREVSAILEAKEWFAEEWRVPTHRFFCSGEPSLFAKIARSWLEDQIRFTPVIWHQIQAWQPYLTQQPKAYSL